MADYGTFPPEQQEQDAKRNSSRRHPLLAALCISTVWFFVAAFIYSAQLWRHSHGRHRDGATSNLTQIQACTISHLHSPLSFVDAVSPISTLEFLSRRDRLAQALVTSGVDAFVLEPGYTFQYYANVSQTDWEPWEPEERPFLMLILPRRDSSSGKAVAKTAFLAPRFEEGRVRMLGIPSMEEEELDIVVWEEHWDPYETLMTSRLFRGSSSTNPDISDNVRERKRPRIMVDEEMRDFITRGLAGAGFEAVGPSPDVELVRQIKSPAEIAILRAVNSGTVEAVRAMRSCLVPGLTEKEVRDVLDAALRSLGFEPFFDIVLFEEHGALPHGGFVTGGKKLTYDTMVVIDVGAHYLGYSSDICRSFLIDPPKTRPSWLSKFVRRQVEYSLLPIDHDCRNHADPHLCTEKVKVWYVVFMAQGRAMEALEANNTVASVDIAARKFIEESGYGDKFTHRVGHGIGIKAHESPYLNKWNKGVRLQPGMTFTDEPGIYLEGQFGVRLEDIFLVREDGQAELLSGRRATSPYDP